MEVVFLNSRKKVIFLRIFFKYTSILQVFRKSFVTFILNLHIKMESVTFCKIFVKEL